MKKRILLALCAIIGLNAAEPDLYTNSVEAVGSYSFNDDNMYLKDGMGWGLRYNYNLPTDEFWGLGAIQGAFDYQFDQDYLGGGSSAVYRLGLNALWYMTNESEITPFALVGVGAQFFSENLHGTEDGLFASIGGGVELQLRGDFSLVGEGKYLYSGDESSLVTSVGIKYSFGQ